MIPIFEKMIQSGIFFFVKFLELDQCFSIKIEIMMVFFVDVIDIILMSILMKNPCFTSRNLTRRI